jgi:hypothetical protein
MQEHQRRRVARTAFAVEQMEAVDLLPAVAERLRLRRMQPSVIDSPSAIDSPRAIDSIIKQSFLTRFSHWLKCPARRPGQFPDRGRAGLRLVLGARRKR